MKVIDLLNKIAKGEEVPKKIRITILDDRITRKYNFFYDEDDQEYKDDELFPLGTRLILERVLNEKVEIIEEEKEIEKISNKTRYYFRTQNNGMTKTDREALDDMFETTYKTIDKIIDELNKIKKEGK